MSELHDVVLVDLDGTLTDSAPGIIESITYAYRTLGLPVPGEEALRSFVGPPLHVSAARHGVSEELMPEFLSAYRVAFVDGGMLNNRVYDGIVEVLDRVYRHARVVVATSKPEIFARQIMRHFGLDQYVVAVCGATLDAARSTKADVIAHALDTVRSSPDGLVVGTPIVMVGDRLHDVEGARVHGIATVGVRWGYAVPGELEDAGAAAIAQRPAELPELIRSALSPLPEPALC